MNHHQHVDEDDDNDNDGVQPASNEEEQEGKDNRGSSWQAMMEGATSTSSNGW
jgi:hypothetical protein